MTQKVLRVVTVVGARPQFIKAAALSEALRDRGHVELLIHTGQHYDHAMSQAFFDELEMHPPHVNLEVGSGTHAEQTAKMLTGIEAVLLKEKPDVVVLFGDTNSTLAGALAASKLHLPTAHVESGLRSFNRTMPEEINRVVTDCLARVLWAPSEVAVRNLTAEGIQAPGAVVEIVGDVMADALRRAIPRADRSPIVASLKVEPRKFLLATIHRAENTSMDVLGPILDVLEGHRAEPTVLPVHPRTRALLRASGRQLAGGIRMIDPVGHADMIALAKAARMVLTDSGGLQKEAYWLKTPCITVRPETEWVETVGTGWNVLVGTDPAKILHAIRHHAPPAAHPELYGDGHAAERCVLSLERVFLEK